MNFLNIKPPSRYSLPLREVYRSNVKDVLRQDEVIVKRPLKAYFSVLGLERFCQWKGALFLYNKTTMRTELKTHKGPNSIGMRAKI